MKTSRMSVFAAAVLFPLVAFVATMMILFDRHQHADAEQALHLTALATVTVVEGYATRQVAFLEGLASGYGAAMGGGRPPPSAELTRTLDNHPEWLAILLLDGSGRLLDEVGNVPSDAVPPGGMTQEAMDTIRVPPQGLGEPYFLKEFAARQAGRLAYRLVALVRAWPLTVALKQSGLPPGFLACVIDGNGNVVSLTKLTQPVGGVIGAAPTDSILAGLAGPRDTLFQATMRGGDPVYAVATAVPGTGWTLVMGGPKQALDAPRQRAVIVLVVGGALAGFLALLLARGVARSLAERERLRFQIGIERERSMAERRFSAIADNFPGVIFRRVLNKNGTVEYPSISAGRFIHGGGSLAPSCLETAILPEDSAGWTEAWRRSAKTGNPVLFEGRAKAESGQPRWFRCAANLHREGANLLWDGAVIDVTAQKQNEELIRQAKESAETASAAKTKFLATASHDLRQPIQSLLLFAHALKAKLRGQEDQRLIEKMSAALETLKSMLDNLLDLSKIEAGMIEPEIRTFDAGTLVRQLFETFEPRFAKAGLRFRCVARTAWVQSDPTLLTQILGNLVDNALKYTPEGGILIACRPRGGMVHIQVIDTGIGIAAADQETIFQEFVQVGEVGREHRQGLGLGLATVRALCRLIDCRLSMSSRVGKGSVFTVELTPAAPPVVQGRQWQLDDEAPLPTQRVLIVDDEDFILEGMRALLEGAGHQVLVAASPAEARRVVEQEGPPDLVLADYRLGPEGNGMQVIQDIRTKVGPVPAAIITGDTEVAKAVPRSAAVVVLHKPLAAKDLQQIIRRMVARAR